MQLPSQIPEIDSQEIEQSEMESRANGPYVPTNDDKKDPARARPTYTHTEARTVARLIARETRSMLLLLRRRVEVSDLQK